MHGTPYILQLHLVQKCMKGAEYCFFCYLAHYMILTQTVWDKKHAAEPVFHYLGEFLKDLILSRCIYIVLKLALSLGSIGQRDETFWFVPPAGNLFTENQARDLPCPQSLSHGEIVAYN